MGRPKKNHDLKIIQGTFRPGREQEPPDFFPLLEKMPPAPDWLGEIGRELWETLGGQLVSSGIITGPDLGAFILLCESRERSQMFRDALTNNGKTSLAAAVADKENAPLYRAFKFEQEFSKKMMQEFGVTPRARNTVSPKATSNTDLETEKMKRLLGLA